jgi:serine/threonine protein kinase
MILGIGQALAEAHRRGHAHRDVKPVNILLTESREPRLTDFDLVTGMDTTGGTQTGALGTFLYAPPEMMERPQDADARADVYGLGMIMAFMLHGDKLPRKALTARERFLENLRATPALKAVLKRATAEDMEDRYPDAAAFCDALRSAIPLVNPPVEGALPVVTRHDQHASTQSSHEGQRTARIPAHAPSPGRYVPGVMILAIMTIVAGFWLATRYQRGENSDEKTVADRPADDTAAAQSHQPIEAPAASPPQASPDTRPDAGLPDAGHSKVTTAVASRPQQADSARRSSTAAKRPSTKKSQPRASGPPQAEGATSSAQQSKDEEEEDICLDVDELWCLLADRPSWHQCCVKYTSLEATLDKTSESEIAEIRTAVDARIMQCASESSPQAEVRGDVRLKIRVEARSGHVASANVYLGNNRVLERCAEDAWKEAKFATGRQSLIFEHIFVR